MVCTTGSKGRRELRTYGSRGHGAVARGSHASVTQYGLRCNNEGVIHRGRVWEVEETRRKPFLSYRSAIQRPPLADDSFAWYYLTAIVVPIRFSFAAADLSRAKILVIYVQQRVGACCAWQGNLRKRYGYLLLSEVAMHMERLLVEHTAYTLQPR